MSCSFDIEPGVKCGNNIIYATVRGVGEVCSEHFDAAQRLILDKTQPPNLNLNNRPTSPSKPRTTK